MDERDERIAADEHIDEWMEFAPSAEDRRELPARRVHPLTIVAVVIGVVVLAGLVVLRPTGTSTERAERELSVLGVANTFYRGEVSSVATGPCAFDPASDCTTVVFAITDGPDRGASHTQVFAAGGTTPEFEIGNEVELAYRAPNGRIEVAEAAACSYDPNVPCVQVGVVMTAGDVVGERYTVEIPDDGSVLATGSDVTVTFDEFGEVLAIVPLAVEHQYQFSDFQRRSVLLIIAIVFAVAVIALGGWRGVAALAGLGATLLIVLVWLIPAILDGRSAVVVALVGSAAVAYVALYVAHGFNLMTTVALLGTLSALLLTTVLSVLVVEAARFSGFTSEESTLLIMFETIDVGGLLLAGMVLGAAGALDDVTVT
ncbi:MAG: YibE/F family protein, partial [Actinomycetota bacterium]|nr:YibE/F family protein [Actinomycetota bacterium]